MIINVIDAPMGRGKTSAAINMINSSTDETRFIYITPYKTEQDRIINRCKIKNFVKPRDDEKIPKIIDLKILLNRGENIVTTHALFHLFDEEVIDLCYNQGYVLIMDEVTDVIEPFKLTRQDRDILFEKYLDVREDGILTWRKGEEDYTGRFEDIKRLVALESLASYNGDIILWLFPVEVFRAFRQSYILTYMFYAQMQCYYYDFYGMKYDYLYVEGNSIDTYRFTDEDPGNEIITYNYSQLIHIVDDPKLNRIGDSPSALSKSWYERNHENVLMEQLKENLESFFRSRKSLYKNGKFVKSSASHNLWTVFSDYEEEAKGRGYAHSHLAHNARATNDYADRSVVAYCVNKYMHPSIKTFFVTNGIAVDEDAYATSEMVQFIWRSSIRKGEHITLYIPSYRMRKLMIDWINENSKTPIETGELLIRSM